MNERYQDNRQGKEAFTKDVIAKVVKQVGYDQASYTADEKGEFVWLFQDRGRVFFDSDFIYLCSETTSKQQERNERSAQRIKERRKENPDYARPKGERKNKQKS